MPEPMPAVPTRIPVGIDPTRPSIARVYDGFLGGKNHYAVDREVMDRILTVVPEAADIARSNRAFLARVCRHLAGRRRVTQFLDCGSGLPTSENTHQIVQKVNDEAITVYVDNDPVVLAHGRALLEDSEVSFMAEADIFKPSEVLDHQVVNRFLELDQPLALLHIGTLHHLEGDSAPDVMREYIERLVPGSYVVISHFFDPQVPQCTEVARRIEDILVNGPLGAGRFRTRAQIEAMLPGLELLKPNATTEPGVVPCYRWWPQGPWLRPASLAMECIGALVGRKL